MKLLRSDQIREADAYTMKNEPIASVDLMERAGKGLTEWILQNYTTADKFRIFVGPGNNGGDGLVIARLLAGKGYHVEVFLVIFTQKFSEDYLINKKRLEDQDKVALHEIHDKDHFPSIAADYIAVDAVFGSGLARPLKGLPAEVVLHINQYHDIIAVDIPSGLFGEENHKTDQKQVIVKAKTTLTIQFPKLSFLFPENEEYTGNWSIVPIGLLPEFIEKVDSPYEIISESLIRPLLTDRNKFAHKGNFGHSLLVAGSYGKMGAAVLASKACLRCGVGLHTAHIPKLGYSVMQTASPETMISLDDSHEIFSRIKVESGFDAIGIGPGIGMHMNTVKALSNLLDSYKNPMVLDADALNILAGNKNIKRKLPAGSILTPHPKEFERLFGKTDNHFQRLCVQIEKAKEYKVFIVLKGAYTSIVTPEGHCFFNPTGNPGMATAGSGDVLTGIILSFLAQGYKPVDAALLGVYLHGCAGDMALHKQSEESMIATDMIDHLSNAFKSLKSD